MEQQKVDMFIMQNKKFFPQSKIMYLREELKKLDDEKFYFVSLIEFKDPTVVFIVSLFFGSLGADKFMIGEIGIGVLKLLTLGCCGIWTILDWCSIQAETRQLNFDKIMEIQN